MELEIMSHQMIDGLAFNEPVCVITISSNDTYPTLADENIRQITYLRFDDTDIGSANLFTELQANLILMHAKWGDERNIKMICQCEAGISRSAGVAAALSNIYNGSDAWVFQDPRYHPNMLVYRTILNVHRRKWAV